MRVAVFFDGKNFYSGWKDGTAGKHLLDFGKMAQWIAREAGGSVLWGAYYYTGIETGDRAGSKGQNPTEAGLLSMPVVQLGEPVHA